MPSVGGIKRRKQQREGQVELVLRSLIYKDLHLVVGSHVSSRRIKCRRDTPAVSSDLALRKGFNMARQQLHQQLHLLTI